MAESKSQTAFARAAVEIDVHESDYLVLLSEGVDCYEKMSYRFPQAGDFEDYLQRKMRLTGAYKDQTGAILTYNKTAPQSWEESKPRASFVLT